MEPNTHPAENFLRLFVYGTLKRGFRYHERYCAGVQSVESAVIWGRLYDLPEGYPALEVPEELVLAHGTSEITTDIIRQHSNLPRSTGRPSGDWDLIRGELMTFPNPLRDLPPIDELEEFQPDGQSLYTRVLVTVMVNDRPITAWTYDGAPTRPHTKGTRLPGTWKGSSDGT